MVEVGEVVPSHSKLVRSEKKVTRFTLSVVTLTLSDPVASIDAIKGHSRVDNLNCRRNDNFLVTATKKAACRIGIVRPRNSKPKGIRRRSTDSTSTNQQHKYLSPRKKIGDYPSMADRQACSTAVELNQRRCGKLHPLLRNPRSRGRASAHAAVSAGRPVKTSARLACSPPTKATRVHSPTSRSLRIFACGNRAGRCTLAGGFSRGSPPFSPALSFRCCSMLPSITFIGSQDLNLTQQVQEFPPKTAIFFTLLVCFEAANGSAAEKRSRSRLLMKSVHFERETSAIGTRLKVIVTAESPIGSRSATRKQNGVQSLALRGDGALDARGSDDLIAPAILSLLQADGALNFSIFHKGLFRQLDTPHLTSNEMTKCRGYSASIPVQRENIFMKNFRNYQTLRCLQQEAASAQIRPAVGDSPRPDFSLVGDCSCATSWWRETSTHYIRVALLRQHGLSTLDFRGRRQRLHITAWDDSPELRITLHLRGRKSCKGDMHRGKEGLGSHGLHFGAMTTSLSVLRASLKYDEQGKNRQEIRKNPCDREETECLENMLVVNRVGMTSRERAGALFILNLMPAVTREMFGRLSGGRSDAIGHLPPPPTSSMNLKTKGEECSLYRKLPLHAVRLEYCTPVQSLALSGDGTLDARGIVALIATVLLGLKRGEKKTYGGVIWAAFHKEILRADECGARREKREIPEKTHRQMASSDTTPTCESPRIEPPGLEPGSPRGEATGSGVGSALRALQRSNSGAPEHRGMLGAGCAPPLDIDRGPEEGPGIICATAGCGGTAIRLVAA
ncbi:hypothetical protein PR048_032545 [Dryococelus australis]|uniref:Uncharacterized protein n=1 Tax=Dryococelus australis TaxID=614101 RepID=A0ABQ9G6K4_9NEOP|nr:hypothetical protein PR048_032545 [Dryococelus australis]